MGYLVYACMEKTCNVVIYMIYLSQILSALLSLIWQSLSYVWDCPEDKDANRFIHITELVLADHIFILTDLCAPYVINMYNISVQ